MHLDRPVGLLGAVDGPGHEDRAATGVEGRLHTLGQPAAGSGVGRHPIDHDLELALPLAIKRGLLVEPHRAAVDPNPDVAGRLQLGKERFRSLAHPQLHRRQEQKPRVGRVFQEPLNRLVDALPTQRGAAVRAVHHPQPRGEHAEEVIHLRERADGAAGRAAPSPLLDRHRWGEPLDPLEEGLWHLANKLPGVGREALDIPPLALGIERVEGQRRLAAAAGAAAHSHGVAGNVGIDIFQVMKRRAADGDAGRPRIARRRADGGEHRCDGRIGIDPLATDGWPAVTGS